MSNCVRSKHGEGNSKGKGKGMEETREGREGRRDGRVPHVYLKIFLKITCGKFTSLYTQAYIAEINTQQIEPTEFD